MTAPVWRSATFAELDAPTLYALLKLRVDVFVAEQADPYPDLDGRDLEPDAVHLWATIAGHPIAYVRVLRESEGVARIGRVVIADDARGSGLGTELMTRALEQVGDRRCVLSAQAHQAGFYVRFGFEVSGPPTTGRIPHVPMIRPEHYGSAATRSSTASRRPV
ncbi:MAG TPA: GNAT family N-acetyltransferase [Jiangellaceae bacterium]